MFFLFAGLHSYVISAAAPSVGAVLGRPIFFLWAIELEVLPFWMCSLTVPSLVALYRRFFKSFSSWVVVLFGSFAGSRVLLALSEHLLQAKLRYGRTDPRLV